MYLKVENDACNHSKVFSDQIWSNYLFWKVWTFRILDLEKQFEIPISNEKEDVKKISSIVFL